MRVENGMPAVLIMCPITESLVPTGLHVRDWRDLDELPDENWLGACSECGRDHDWMPRDAVLSTESA